MAILGAIAMFSHLPFIFPSLGPTAFLVFTTPTLPTASPRNVMVGHALGIACGFASLWLFGLTQAPPALSAGVDVARLLAAALSSP